MDTITLAYSDLPTRTSPAHTVYVYAAMHDHPDPSTDDPCPYTGTHVTRFGDRCCNDCGTELSWSPDRVRAGVFGSAHDTAAWVARTEGEHLELLMHQVLREVFAR